MKRIKRAAACVLICTFLLGMLPVSANGGISVYVDNVMLSFDVQPQIIDGRTMVPMRKIFESLGAVVTWDDATHTATGKKGETTVNISINSKILFKNGVPKTLDVAPALIEARTLVPVRAIAESFDCEVLWIEEIQAVKISTNANMDLKKTPLSASEISEKVSPSVFYIEVYDEKANVLGSGSGFFILSNGEAVTNYHVIEDSASAQITTIYGEKFPVSHIVAFDEELDVAIIKVNKTSTSGKTVSGFSAVTMANSDEIKAGQNIFALGSPVGLQNTISNGIISNAKQIVNGEVFIQITAPISHGSSGGALLNEYGEVLGITSAGIDEAQNIGFAIPINVINLFNVNAAGISYDDFAANNKKFTLEVSSTTVEVEVGESVEILIYAEGKSEDWSILWNTEQRHLIDCTWGDWLEDYRSVCPLTITGKKEGIATITIYSNVDFKGKNVTVYVKKPPTETYPSACASIPTYTAVTGVRPIDYQKYENDDLYVYNYNMNDVQIYVDYLLENGFEFYKEKEGDRTRSYYYITPENELIGIVLAYKWHEIWIYIPTK